MEIKKIPTNFFKLAMYFLTMRIFFASIAISVAFFYAVTSAVMYSALTENDKYINYFIGIYPIAVFAIAYFLTKIFGIFQIIEKYNKFIQFLIILLLSILFKLSYKFIPYFTASYDNITDISYYLPFVWFLRKFFNFLTLKFPFPFKKIEYIFSFGYLKDIFLKEDK